MILHIEKMLYTFFCFKKKVRIDVFTDCCTIFVRKFDILPEPQHIYSEASLISLFATRTGQFVGALYAFKPNNCFVLFPYNHCSSPATNSLPPIFLL